MKLTVMLVLSGQTLSFADDNAASGAVAVQEPETHGEVGHSEPETPTEGILSARDDSEATDGDENGLPGDFEPGGSRPAHGDPV